MFENFQIKNVIPHLMSRVVRKCLIENSNFYHSVIFCPCFFLLQHISQLEITLCIVIKLKFTKPEVEVYITRTSHVGYQYLVSLVFAMRA